MQEYTYGYILDNESDNDIEINRDNFYEEWNEYMGYHTQDEWFLDPQ